MIALSKENPRHGYRRAWALLRWKTFLANKERICQLCREKGLKITNANTLLIIAKEQSGRFAQGETLLSKYIQDVFVVTRCHFYDSLWPSFWQALPKCLS